MLEVRELAVTYRRTVRALHSVSLEVGEGAVVAVLGSNGAGKSTLMRGVSRTLGEFGGAVVSGTITFDDEDITRAKPTSIVGRGLVQVPEGRGIFGRLTVEENLKAGGFGLSRREVGPALERATELFPELEPALSRRASLLSGGEQQMLAIGRALMSQPRMLLLDEPSLGLAPHLIQRVAGAIQAINADGTSILLVEQNAAMALELASSAYVLSLGETSLSGPADELARTDEVRRLYLGGDSLAEGNGGALVDDIPHAKRLSRWEG